MLVYQRVTLAWVDKWRNLQNSLHDMICWQLKKRNDHSLDGMSWGNKHQEQVEIELNYIIISVVHTYIYIYRDR